MNRAGRQLALGFDALAPAGGTDPLAIAPGATLLPGFAVADAERLLRDLATVVDEAPFRGMTTPGGRRMSVETTCCGPFGWVSDRRGYRYEPLDPVRGRPWPAMPGSFRALAADAARAAGFPGFVPDACLVNRYAPGARMSLHQDRDERDVAAPIVSVSLGLTATFLFGGPERSDPVRRVPLVHGDVVVWGGPARLSFHGILPVRDGEHPRLGASRVNLTFRKAR